MKKWYQQNWFIILSLFICFPIGICLLWECCDWKKEIKIGITVSIALILAIWMFVSDETEQNNTTDATPNPTTVAQTVASTIEPTTSAPTPEPTIAVQTPSSAPATEFNDNLLMLAPFRIAPVMNGFKTEKIGEYGYIKMPKSDIKNVSKEDFKEFIDTRFNGNNLKWIAIIFDDGTMIHMPTTIAGTYGTIMSDEDCIDKSLGTIFITENGYEYEPIGND